MPEGDTVWLAGQRLHEALAGDLLVRSDFRVPSLATVDLSGQAVLEVVPRGKHLLTRLSGGLTLHTHFRMDGSWHLYRPGDRWTGGPEWQVRAVLETASWQAVGYRLPVVDCSQWPRLASISRRPFSTSAGRSGTSPTGTHGVRPRRNSTSVR